MTPEEQQKLLSDVTIVVEALVGLVHPAALAAEVQKVHQRRQAAAAQKAPVPVPPAEAPKRRGKRK